MNYSELQTEVIAYFRRGSISARVSAWIALAESYLFREMDIRSLSVSATGTTTNGLITLPADFLSVVRLTVTYNGAERNLDYLPALDDVTTAGDYPTGYSIQGDSLRLYPYAGTGQAYTLYYTPKVEALSLSNTSNWILENAPDLYLYASCWQGACEMKNTAEENKLINIVRPLLDSVKQYSERSGLPKSAGMQIKPRRGFA